MAGTAVVVSLAGGVVATRVNWTDLEVIGIDDGQQLQRKDLSELRLRIVAGGPAAGAVRVTLNGTDVPVTEAQRGEALITSRKALVDAIRPGKNTYVVTLGGRYMLGGERIERTFDFDPSGPTLMLPRAVVDPGNGEVISMRGIANDTASLRANGQAIPLGEGGGFQLDIAPGASEVVLVAKDKDGNPSRTVLPVAATAAKPDYPATTGVHITAAGWSDPTLRASVIELVKSGRINAVQLDIKDEGGEVGYLSDVPLAKKIGATRDLYDPEQAIKELHDLDVRVIGRVVNFLDPTMAQWAADNGRTDLIVLNGDGSAPLANDYGDAAFTNLASPEVRDYQMDLADEAVRLGFDEILYDYVRRPEGDLSSMKFNGLRTPADISIARFVAETRERLGEDAALGVSVFGIASTRPEQIAQDIQLLAPQVDYISPMVYPSHWGPGEFDVADPVRQPGDIVGASVADFERAVAGSGAAVVPWLQDFDSGSVVYDAPMVRAQIDAARFVGAEGFLLWNSGSEYTAGALDPVAD
ncbi:MAG: hypothetical protein H0X22_03265 [Acidimicrobiia bacterium]|nr:hypothetical protein [Acidimicrobiia bacterium]